MGPCVCGRPPGQTGPGSSVCRDGQGTGPGPRRSNPRRSNPRRSNLRRSNLRRSNLRRSNLRRRNRRGGFRFDRNRHLAGCTDVSRVTPIGLLRRSGGHDVAGHRRQRDLGPILQHGRGGRQRQGRLRLRRRRRFAAVWPCQGCLDRGCRKSRVNLRQGAGGLGTGLGQQKIRHQRHGNFGRHFPVRASLGLVRRKGRPGKRVIRGVARHCGCHLGHIRGHRPGRGAVSGAAGLGPGGNLRCRGVRRRHGACRRPRAGAAQKRAKIGGNVCRRTVMGSGGRQGTCGCHRGIGYHCNHLFRLLPFGLDHSANWLPSVYRTSA